MDEFADFGSVAGVDACALSWGLLRIACFLLCLDLFPPAPGATVSPAVVYLSQTQGFFRLFDPALVLCVLGVIQALFKMMKEVLPGPFTFILPSTNEVL